MNDLAKRAVACAGWQWLPGMLSQSGQRVVAEMPDSDGEQHIVARPYHPGGPHKLSPQVLQVRVALAGELPDLTDPATLGCLLALVQEAWDDYAAACFSIDYGPGGVMWQSRQTVSGRPLTERCFATEAEALVAALEALG